VRLDQYLARVLSLSRNRAQFLIESGLVFVDGKTVSKASFEIGETQQVSVREDPRLRYVARSALKLAGFLETYPIGISGKSCLDIGSSTGGFTQVLLENGAARVTAVDVGTAQLHETLRGDSRIVSLENTDIRTWESTELFDVITIDVSFISLREVIPHAVKRLKDSGCIVALFKPQFEVGARNLRKTGVPKNDQVIASVLLDFRAFVSLYGLYIRAESPSTLAGEAGNLEYLFALTKTL
jgi:23S rRNA (cytidine1920-2'-O)/16S rRNA (cytidine1409-2'-O)-methyltransferase